MFRDYFLVLVEDKLDEFAVFFHFAAQAFGIVAIYLDIARFCRYFAGPAEGIIFVGVLSVLEQVASSIVAIGFHLTVDGLTCQPVVDVVDILLLDVLGRPCQTVTGVIVGESFRIGRIFGLFQTVQAVIGVERLTRQLTFLDSLALPS